MRAAVLCFASLLSIASPAAAQAPVRDRPDPAGTAVISGRVILAGSDQPLGRVDVRASSPVLKTPRAVKTDAGGRYEIKGLPAGRYVVSAVKTNFVTTAFGQKRPAGPGTPFDLADGQVAAHVDFAMPRAGVIAGRVLDEFGDPMPGVQVAVVALRYMNGERRLSMPPSQGFSPSNDIGEFRIFGLSPGSYYVSATLRDFLGGESDDRSGYAATYFPGTGNIAEAQRITIGAGQAVSGITLTLLPVRTSRISGIALDSEGRPMAGVNVIAMNRVTAFGPFRNTLVKPDGTFSIGGVTPGDYIVRAGGGPGGGDDTAATAAVAVAGADITDVQLIGARPSSVSGRVVFEPGPAAPATSVRIMLQHPDSMMGGSTSNQAKADSSFELKASPGHGVIAAFVPGPGDWRVKRVTLNGADVTDDGIDVPANAPLTGLVVEMTTHFPEVSGRVLGENGEPERDCWIIAFPQDQRRWTQVRYMSAARPDPSERYAIRLPAGDYFAVAVDDVQPSEWYDPDYLGRIRERAVPFSVADGEKKTLDLKLASRPF